MQFAYLSALILSLIGLSLADYRYKLAFFYDKQRTFFSLCLGVLFFLVWDIAGVVFDIFYVGSGRYLTGIRVLPEVPIEELFFLTLLCYTSLLVWRKLADKS
jgi:lycopene cyclase domain-containing protein